MGRSKTYFAEIFHQKEIQWSIKVERNREATNVRQSDSLVPFRFSLPRFCFHSDGRMTASSLAEKFTFPDSSRYWELHLIKVYGGHNCATGQWQISGMMETWAFFFRAISLYNIFGLKYETYFQQNQKSMSVFTLSRDADLNWSTLIYSPIWPVISLAQTFPFTFFAATTEHILIPRTSKISFGENLAQW